MNGRLGRLYLAVTRLTRAARRPADWERANKAQRVARRAYDQWAWEIHLPKRTLAEYRADLARGRVDLLEAELCGPWGRPGDVVHVSFRDRGLAGEPVVTPARETLKSRRERHDRFCVDRFNGHPVEDAFDLPAHVAAAALRKPDRGGPFGAPALVAPPGADRRELRAAAARAWAA